MIDWDFTSKEEISQLYNKLGSIRAVAKKIGVARGTIRKKMITDHIPFMQRGKSPVTLRHKIQCIPQCKKDSKTTKELARMIGCPYRTMSRYLKGEKNDNSC